MNAKNINIETFDLWAINNKDIDMQKGHAPAVAKMISIINSTTNIMKNNFKFLDLGCGNGWVVRKISKNKFCKLAIGVDGAKTMIKKARELSSKKEKFIYADIETLPIEDKFDIVFSMETFYYFKNPATIINNIYNNLLNPYGFFIIGIDHYLENKQSLNWDKEYNLSTNTLSCNEWKNFFIKSNFSNIKSNLFGEKDNWNGTLIISGQKL
jgi:SAM-dependent methyltransferase